MNFTEFRKSPFAKGKIYDIEKQTLVVPDDERCFYFTSPVTGLNLDYLSDTLTTRHQDWVLHLFQVLKFPNFVPPDFKIEIIRQWKEVKACVAELNVPEHLFIKSFLTVQEPGVPVPKHKHVGTKHIITFCFTIEDDNHNSAFDNIENKIFLYNDDRITVKHELQYPESGNFYFDIEECVHSATGGKWRFFWGLDLAERIEIPNDIRGWNRIY